MSQGAALNLKIARPGGTTGMWSPTETPYMTEPMDTLGSRHYDAVIFVGPSQSGKTVGLGEGWMAHAVVNDPGDMLMVQMSQGKAREYSMQRIDRAIANSPNIKALMGGAQSDNTHDKQFRHGMWLRIGWPTVGNLSSTSYRYVFLTDYDRFDDDIGGEGDAFGLASARTRTFLSRGMVCVESSPGREIVDPNWRPQTNHEAPPVKGILGIYNRSDRRRLYWKCPHCESWFEARPGLSLFGVPDTPSLIETIRQRDIEEMVDAFSRVLCPASGCIIKPEHKAQMNRNGVWLRDGLSITADNVIQGTARTSRIAGFWMGGMAVAYQTWPQLLRKHFQAALDYALSGSEESLKTTANTDQGVPYMTQLLVNASSQLNSPESRKEERPRFIVPDDTRCLIAAVDIQGGQNSRFIVQVHAVAPNFEETVIDRYEITKSQRVGMGEDFAPIEPAVYAEDWDELTRRVVMSTYRTNIEGKELRVRLVVVDTGGEEGVTEKSYAWYRRVRALGLASRVMMVKGRPTKGAPLIKETIWGADVPGYLLNTDPIKDTISNNLKRPVPGPGYYHFPNWLPQPFFDELESETRNADGTWTQVRKRNEAFDLCVYIHAGGLRLGLDKIKDWEAVPPNLAPLLRNVDLISAVDRREMHENVVLPKVARPTGPTFRGRRMVRSKYLA